MNTFLSLVIVAVTPEAPIDLPASVGMEVFACAFDQSWDENYDGWPDGWSRRRGAGFPKYVSVRISQEDSLADQGCLRIDLDGGGAVAYSPPVRVGPLFDYIVEGWIKTQGLEHDRAFLSITFVDEDRRRLETFYSESVSRGDVWKQLRIGPVTPSEASTWYAVVGLHLEPGKQADLTGNALFDEIRLARLPQLSLDLDPAHHVFTDSNEITIACRASGFADPEAAVTFHLEDAFGTVLVETRKALSTHFVPIDFDISSDPPNADLPGLSGRAEWKPPISNVGFYRARADLHAAGTPVRRGELTFVVLEPMRAPSGSQFGWSLEHAARPLPLSDLSRVIGQAGIGWVKYPVWWTEDAEREDLDALARFVERLTVQGIETVGLLKEPPESLRARFDDPESLSAAQVLAADPEVWSPSIEWVMGHLATRVRWWQLGSDDDTGFIEYPNLPDKIGQVKQAMDRIGNDVNLGFGWRWLHQVPATQQGSAPWRFLALSADPPLSHPELAEHLAAEPPQSHQRWVLLRPLDRRTHSLDTRVNDLIKRMITAAIHGAEGVFAADSFHDNRGLFHNDGTPGELFLPWRTTALVLGGARYLGSIQMPEGSQNHVFSREDDAVMVVWSDKPTREEIYLGPEVQQLDLWGRTTTPDRKGHRQAIDVSPLPTFLVGVDGTIARWRHSFVLSGTRLPSVVGARNEMGLKWTNASDQAVAGEMRLVAPEAWKLDPQKMNLRLDAAESLVRPLDVTLPYDVSNGRHRLRADFKVHTDRPMQFSVYRTIDVGLGDLSIDIVARLTDQGGLEIRQRVVNETDREVNFDCQLLVPNRRSLSTRIVRLGRGHDVQSYLLPDGRELEGKTLWLRAEEIGGRRVLNCRFVVPTPREAVGS